MFGWKGYSVVAYVKKNMGIVPIVEGLRSVKEGTRIGVAQRKIAQMQLNAFKRKPTRKRALHYSTVRIFAKSKETAQPSVQGKR